MEDFDVKDYLRHNGYDNKMKEQIQKEIDLMYHIMVSYMKYTRFEMTREEFEEQLANILTHSLMNRELDINAETEPDDMLDNVLNFDKIEDYYGNDIDDNVLLEMKSYFKKKVKEINRINEFS
jgi:GGDEF domain-containing protein